MDSPRIKCPHVETPPSVGENVTLFLKKGWDGDNLTILNSPYFLIGDSEIYEKAEDGGGKRE